MARLNCLSARFAQHYYFIDLAANNDHKRNSYNDMERDLLANHTADWLFVSVLQCESLEAKWIPLISKPRNKHQHFLHSAPLFICFSLGSLPKPYNFEVQFPPRNPSEQQTKNLRLTVNKRGVNKEFELDKGAWTVAITSHSTMLLLVRILNLLVCLFFIHTFIISHVTQREYVALRSYVVSLFHPFLKVHCTTLSLYIPVSRQVLVLYFLELFVYRLILRNFFAFLLFIQREKLWKQSGEANFMKKKCCYHSYEKRKKLDKYNKLNKNNWCSNVVIFRSQGYGSSTISLRHSAGGSLTLVLEDSFTYEKRFAMFSEFKRT